MVRTGLGATFRTVRLGSAERIESESAAHSAAAATHSAAAATHSAAAAAHSAAAATHSAAAAAHSAATAAHSAATSGEHHAIAIAGLRWVARQTGGRGGGNRRGGGLRRCNQRSDSKQNVHRSSPAQWTDPLRRTGFSLSAMIGHATFHCNR
jgi:hypothetical protein